jgi:REP element-mobilizing transposase RayT
MPRRPRLFIPGATYHVYCRVARGEFAFSDTEEVSEFVRHARRVRDLDGWRVLAWCVMSNHYHLVVATSRTPLWRSMLRLQAAVARGFNRRRQYLGRFWQSRYRARVVDSQEYFEQAVAYVHLNPMAAGLTVDPSEYPHSGHAAALGLQPARLLDTTALLGGFGGRPWHQARSRYIERLRIVTEAGWMRDGVEGLPWWTKARDVEEIACPTGHPEAVTYEDQRVDDHRRCLDLDELIRRYGALSALSIADLASRARSTELLRGRIELTLLAVHRYEHRCSSLAAILCKDRTTVSRWLGAGLRLEQADQDFRRRIDLLDSALSAPEPGNAAMQRVAP